MYSAQKQTNLRTRGTGSMVGYIVKRFLMMIVTILIIASLTFFLMFQIPGSPFDSDRTTNPTIQANLESYYNLDKPVYVQYFTYLERIITFDFGPSIKKPTETVNGLLERGFPISFELGMVTILVALISGVLLGTIAALRHNGIIDYIAMTIAVVGISLPNFILATVLIQIFAVNFRMVPSSDVVKHKSYGTTNTRTCDRSNGHYCRLTRASMIEVLTQDYIKMARAKGLKPWRIVIPICTFVMHDVLSRNNSRLDVSEYFNRYVCY